MAFKHILLDIGVRPDAAPPRDIALAIAREHDALVTGLYVRPFRERQVPGMAGAGASLQLSSSFQRSMELQNAAEERTERELIDGFTKAAAAAGVRTEHHVEIATEGSVIPYFVRLGRVSDAIVLGGPKDAEGAAAAVHDVLFGAGVPVIIVPQASDSVGRRIVIAWNGSRESARAVKDALPVLERAERVSIVCVGLTRPGGNVQAGAELAQYLTLHGIEASLDNLNETSAPVGDTILDRARELKADLLVMGAYGHSRLREFVLGGVTKRILERSAIPVLMSH
jgi:nucleotide-binding universal stress UspA family protein